jgi:hypothetical protein
MIVKGENRDTAWFSMLDSEWPARKAGFERWLDPGNFDAAGVQRDKLQPADRQAGGDCQQAPCLRLPADASGEAAMMDIGFSFFDPA